MAPRSGCSQQQGDPPNLSRAASTGSIVGRPGRGPPDSSSEEQRRIKRSYKAGKQTSIWLVKLEERREVHARMVEAQRADPKTYAATLVGPALAEARSRAASLGSSSPSRLELMRDALVRPSPQGSSPDRTLKASHVDGMSPPRLGHPIPREEALARWTKKSGAAVPPPTPVATIPLRTTTDDAIEGSEIDADCSHDEMTIQGL